MKTKLVKTLELKALSLGVGLPVAYVALSIIITLVCKAQRPPQVSNASTNQATEIVMPNLN